MIGLIGTAACVLTDSSTVQEESTIVGAPCLTSTTSLNAESRSNKARIWRWAATAAPFPERWRKYCGGGKKGACPNSGMAFLPTGLEHLNTWAREISLAWHRYLLAKPNIGNLGAI